MLGSRALVFLVSVWVSCIVSWGCASPAPRCTPGLSVGCACRGGALGAQTCRADGTYAPCDCARGCSPGERSLCLCEDGASGTQLCLEDGSYERCDCLPRCVPGSTNACLCPSGRSGSQVCRGDRTYEACLCREGCVDGESRACSCADGRSSAQTCAGERFGPCACDLAPDAGMLDGGVCSGCACGAPATPELLPDLPAAGELGPILDALEIFVLREGYLVRTTTELQLRDRDGALRTSLDLVTVDADVVGEDVFVLDELSTIRWLDGALREHTRVPLRVPCAGLVALDCGRALCNGVLYDLVAGSATAPLAGELQSPEWPVRIPGQNTIAGTSRWVRIDPRGTPHLIPTPTRQDFSVALGWPGTLLVDEVGGVFDTSTCGTAPIGDTLPPGCGESVGPLGLAGRILEMAPGEGTELYALVETEATRRFLRVDVSTREILSSVPFVWPFELSGMAYDPWADRLLVWGAPCSVCEVRLRTVEAP